MVNIRKNSAEPPCLTLAAPLSIRPAVFPKLDDPAGAAFSAGTFATGIFEGTAMSWRCELTGKRPLVGHKVSHSNIKTKRRFLPNLRNVTLISDTLNRKVHVRVSANALRTVDHRGGLDAFLLKAKDDELAPKMRELKRQIVKKQAAAAG